MKKIILFFLLGFFALSCKMSPAFAEQASYFAKVQNTGVFLCSSPSENSSIFEIPYSYFVKVETAVDDYYKVSYDGIEGYVKKDKVTLMNGVPQNPYAKATFKVFVPYYLYQSPSQNSSAVAIDTNATFTYYGTKVGQPISSASNIWYYASVKIDESVHYGYVFSGVTDYLTTIQINNESFKIISDKELTSSPNSELKKLSTGTKIMLIVAISVPSILILYFLIKPTKILQVTKSRKNIKKERKRTHHGDYFEFDENDI